MGGSSSIVRKKKGNSPKAERAGAVSKKSCIEWGVQTWIEVIILAALGIMILLAVLELFLR